jgi:hypothetical protein
VVAHEDLLPSLRRDGNFTAGDLKKLRANLLYEIASWFHELHEERRHANMHILDGFKNILSQHHNPVIISFNWDCELDRLLFGDSIEKHNYGLDKKVFTPPVLLKPHGSLNWYPSETGEHIKAELRRTLWKGTDGASESMFCFLRWRAPKSSHRQYVPWIVPPTHVKKFEHGMMQRIWRACVDCLSVAKRVFFVGYSLPTADWHSRYIFRCGFHNQREGRPHNGKDRGRPTGPGKVYVVNPDNSAFRRIELVADRRCVWLPITAKEWVETKSKSGR